MKSCKGLNKDYWLFWVASSLGMGASNILQYVILDERHTEYTDKVEIHAGWKTFFIWLWANAFYKHRQKMWIKLLKGATK